MFWEAGKPEHATAGLSSLNEIENHLFTILYLEIV